jgi:hypothetical protein
VNSDYRLPGSQQAAMKLSRQTTMRLPSPFVDASVPTSATRCPSGGNDAGAGSYARCPRLTLL